eukprot:scaffold1112_cov116-Isochrysis_galbana.AAC.34
MPLQRRQSRGGADGRGGNLTKMQDVQVQMQNAWPFGSIDRIPLPSTALSMATSESKIHTRYSSKNPKNKLVGEGDRWT